MKRNEQYLRTAVLLLIGAGADSREAEQYISDLALAVPEVACRYIPGILRWTTGGSINVESDEELNRLNLFLQYIKNTEAGECYNDDFNGLSFSELVEFFKLDLDADDYVTPVSVGYSVVEIKSYEELQRYREWTDDWCIAISEIAFADYSMDGENIIRLIVRDDFRNVPKKPSAGFPNDSYGNSILCVILGHDGGIDSLTNRWNAIGKECDNPGQYLEGLLGHDYMVKIRKQ